MEKILSKQAERAPSGVNKLVANRFWVGGTASWDGTASTKWAVTSGGAGGLAVPTTTDDVFLDAASGAVTVTVNTVTGSCQNLTCTGFTGTLTLTTSLNTAPTAGGTVLISSGMTIGGAGTLGITSAAGTNSTLTTNGKTLPSVNFTSAATGGVIFADAFTSSGTVTLTSGGFNTNNQACSWGIFSSVTSNTRTFTLGSSAITITGAGTSWNLTNTGMAITNNTATVALTTTGAVFFTGSIDYRGMSLVLPGSGGISGPSASLILANFTRVGAATKTDFFTLTGAGAGLVCTGTFTMAGNSTVNRLMVQSNVFGTARTITAAAVSLANIDFQDTAGAGTAAPFTGTSLGNALGNSGITFDTPVAQTRTGAGGNWSTAANWTSRVPLPQDNVIVGAGASGTISVDMPRIGASVDYTGFTGTTQSSGGFTTTLFGSLTLAAGMTYSNNTGMVLAGRGSHTVTVAGKTFVSSLVVSAPGGTYSFLDNLITTSTLQLVGGTFDTTANATVSALIFQTSGTLTKVINSGTGIWSITSLVNVSGNVWLVPSSVGNTVNGRPNITIATASASTRNITGGNFSYGALTYTVAGSTGPLTIANSNSFSSLNFSDVTNARTLTLTNGTTTTVTDTFNVNGTVGKLMTVNSSTPGSAATLSKPNGTVSCNYLSLQDSTAQGGASWFAGANSVNVSNNSGWIFANAPSAGQSSNFMPFFNA